MDIKEIAGWLREAGSYHILSLRKRFEDRAALVESMTCRNCRWWAKSLNQGFVTGFCLSLDTKNSDCSDTEACGPDFGCIRWEVKEGK